MNSERLRWQTKLAYGAGELGPAMAGSTLIFFQLIFLTNVAGLNAGLAGSVLLIGKAWDAVTDPIIGWLSDKTDTRWGRRLPWMLASALPFAICFSLMWWVPGLASADNQWGLFAYYVTVAIFFNTFYTTLALPHTSLTPELSHDYDERSRISGFRMAYSLGGSVGGLIAAQLIFLWMAEAQATSRYLALGCTISLIGLIAMIYCLTGVWKVAIQKDQERRRLTQGSRSVMLPIKQQLAIVLSNRPFLIVCAIYLCSWMAIQFTASILPFYVEDWMRLGSNMFPLVALTVQGTALLIIPAWGWLSTKIGKRPVYFYGMIFCLGAQAGLLLLQPTQTTLLFFLAFFAGFGISVCYLIPNAMLPDVIEYDEWRTHQRREGIYYGFFVFLQKMALAGSTFIIGQVLNWAGYLSSGPGQANPIQPDSALLAIRIATGPLPALVLLIGLFFAWIYPITKEKHTEILTQLAERRLQERSINVDPNASREDPI